MNEIRVIGDRTTNAQLMADCARLGYLDGRVLDLTYGLGRFWTECQPTHLITNDLHTAADLTVDWTAPDAHARFAHLGPIDVVVFDPPYKLNGTASLPSDAGYGVHRAGDRMAAIEAGLQTARLIQPRRVLVKVQDQVVAGRKVWQTMFVWEEMLAAGGWKLRDQLHVSSYRPQPGGRRQVHARQDYSTLMVWEVCT